MANITLTAAALAACAVAAQAGTLTMSAFTVDGRPMSKEEFVRCIRPTTFSGSGGRKEPGKTGIFVTDLDGKPVPGRPWLDSSEPSKIAIRWEGADHVKISLPWPIQKDGFSTVTLDKEGTGYADGETIVLNEEIAVSEYKHFRSSLEARRKHWDPPYKSTQKFDGLEQRAVRAMASAHGAKDPASRARAYDRALTALALAWEQLLFEHGSQIARGPSRGNEIRCGLTLDGSLADRLLEYRAIHDRLELSGADWVRLIFRPNPGDVAYSNQRSFNEYDQIVDDLAAMKIHIMGGVLDSRYWPAGATPGQIVQRTKNLAEHYKAAIHSWEVAGDINGNWLGDEKNPLTEEAAAQLVRDGAAEVKRINPANETVASVYWWQGTAGDDTHPTLQWLKYAVSTGALAGVDVIGLNIFPDEAPMGLALEAAGDAINRLLPDKKLMVGGFGYADGDELHGYWWWNAEDVDAARKDLLKYYVGASAALPKSVGGIFWWSAVDQLLKPGSAGGLLDVYRRSVREIKTR